MATRPYVPAVKSDAGGLLRVVVSTLIAAALVGAVEGFLSRWVTALVLFPAALGWVIGAAGHASVLKHHVRMPLALAGVGLVAALFGFLVQHGVLYRQARSEVVALLQREPDSAPFIQEHGLGAAVDAVFAEQSGLPPFIGYLKKIATVGFTVPTGRAPSVGGTDIRGTAIYAVWLFGWLIAGGIAVRLLIANTRDPFCERCNSWYYRNRLLSTGAGTTETENAAMDRLDRGEYLEAARNLGVAEGATATHLMLKGCDSCDTHEPLLELVQVTGLNRKKQKVTVLYSTLLTPAEGNALRAATKPPPRPPPQPLAAVT